MSARVRPGPAALLRAGLSAPVLVAGAVAGVPAAGKRLSARSPAGEAFQVAEDALPLLQEKDTVLHDKSGEDVHTVPVDF